MNTTGKRVAVPFLFRAADGLGANGKLIARTYGREVEAVFTRAAVKRVPTNGGGLGLVPQGVPALATAFGVPVLSLEAARTNLVTYSEDLSNAAWTKNGVTANAKSYGALSMALFTTAAGATQGYANQTVTFTGNGSKVVSVFVAAGTAPTSSIQLFDSTAGAIRGTLDLTWTNGVPTAAFDTGGGATGTALPVEDAGGGLYRVGMVANGVVAANSNGLYLYAINNNDVSTAGTMYFGGAHAENATALGSYVKTTAAAAASTADSCYFPFTLPPQELTVYIRGYERGTNLGSTDTAVFAIGDGSNASLFVDGGSSSYSAFHRRSGDVSSTAAAATVYGDLVELRVLLAATGAVTLAQAVNAGAEAVASASAANALATAWGASRFYLGSRSTVPGLFDFTHAAVALGTKTLAEMRVVAEV